MGNRDDGQERTRQPDGVLLEQGFGFSTLRNTIQRVRRVRDLVHMQPAAFSIFNALNRMDDARIHNSSWYALPAPIRWRLIFKAARRQKAQGRQAGRMLLRLHTVQWSSSPLPPTLCLLHSTTMLRRDRL